MSIGCQNADIMNIYSNFNEINEKVSKFIYILYVRMTVPGAILPIFLASIVGYFMSGSKEDAFQLPILMMYTNIFEVVFGKSN